MGSVSPCCNPFVATRVSSCLKNYQRHLLSVLPLAVPDLPLRWCGSWPVSFSSPGSSDLVSRRAMKSSASRTRLGVDVAIRAPASGKLETDCCSALPVLPESRRIGNHTSRRTEAPNASATATGAYSALESAAALVSIFAGGRAIGGVEAARKMGGINESPSIRASPNGS
jgi:hypothetical protein